LNQAKTQPRRLHIPHEIRNTASADAAENKNQNKANLKHNSLNIEHSTEAYPPETAIQKPTPQPDLENKFTSQTLGTE
jgi:hypothetical protein